MRIKELLERRQADPRGCRPPLIVCLGDSVTQGCFECEDGPGARLGTVYEPESAYAARLQRLLRERFPAATPTVLNAGVGGDNAPGGRARLERDALSFRPDLLIVCYGLNDCVFPDREAGLRQFARALEGIFDEVRARGTECLLMTPNAMCSRANASLPQKFAEFSAVAAGLQNDGVLGAYVDRARRIAQERDLPVADAYAAWLEMQKQGRDTTALLANSINHPTRELHALFAELCEAAILAP